jgi:hypothetical protein
VYQLLNLRRQHLDDLVDHVIWPWRLAIAQALAAVKHHSFIQVAQ